MQNLWDNTHAVKHVDPAQQAAYALGTMSAEPSLINPGGACVSGREVTQNLFGEDHTTLYAVPVTGDPIAVSYDDAARLLTLDSLDESALAGALNIDILAARIVAIHTAINAPFVAFAGPSALLAVMSTVDAAERLNTLYPDVTTLPYIRDTTATARTIRDHLTGDALILMGRGVIAWGETAQSAYERVLQIANTAETAVKAAPSGQAESSERASVGDMRETIAKLRYTVSMSAGAPLSLSVCDGAACRGFAADESLLATLKTGLPAVGAAEALGGLPRIGRDIPADTVPRALLDTELGAVGIGATVQAATHARDVLHHTLDVIRMAEALGGYVPLDTNEADAVALPFVVDSSTRPLFAGEVCLVTGAASGIGKACAEAFLHYGAAVVGLDINPAIETLFERPNYLGMVCDITNGDAVSAAYETTVKAFGGLDMLVLNAGVFPKGTRIAELALEDFMRVMHINLDANLVLMRLAHSLMKLAPGKGRVVLNGSRNALAPGPGAAAYSTSKAALTQLGRVAALEWGEDGIRVNMIHAHAVFDTGLWTPEVLAARAAHYGITVQEYKTNNVLKTEVKSRDVGELAAAMCGPLFARTTGAQVPIDGGSDRVI